MSRIRIEIEAVHACLNACVCVFVIVAECVCLWSSVSLAVICANICFDLPIGFLT